MSLNNLKHYFRRAYRLTLSLKKQEELVWKDLKKIHVKAGWNSGVYENQKVIETYFEIGKGINAAFNYKIHEGYLHFRVKFIENYPLDLTSDIFILASHFNNLLRQGVVKIDVESEFIEYDQEIDLRVSLLYSDEILNELRMHVNTTKLIYSGFNRLIQEQEAPAIIIVDLLATRSDKNEKED